MDDGNLAILVDAKLEYTKQLVNIISPNIFLGVKTLYNKCNEICKLENSNDILYRFQVELSEIPKWNQEVINSEYHKLIENSKCDWLEDLLTAVFVSHTRILTSINSNKNKNKINLKIPKVDHFIHLCYIEIARYFWKNTYLFDDSVNKYEYQRNRRETEQIIDTIINETIRKQLPVKHILKEYLGSEFKDNVPTEQNNLENFNEYEKENLRKMVKNEIENCSREKLSKLKIDYDIIKNLNSNIIDDKQDHEPGKDKEPIETAAPDKDKEPIETATPDKDKDKEPIAPTKPCEDKKPIGTAPSTPGEDVITTLKKEDMATTNETPNIKINIDENMSSDEIEINNLIDDEINKLNDSPDKNDNLKIEDLNLEFDDLSKLEEVYIENEPKNMDNIENLNNINNINIDDSFISATDNEIHKTHKPLDMNNKIDNEENNKIKTIYIDTKNDKKNTFNETDIDINYDSNNDLEKYKKKKFSKNDYSFFSN